MQQQPSAPGSGGPPQQPPQQAGGGGGGGSGGGALPAAPFPSAAYMQHLYAQQALAEELTNFWEKMGREVEEHSEVLSDFKNQALPLARIKKIMKSDEDVRMISAEAPVLFARACEFFIQELTIRSWAAAQELKRRTMQRSDVATAIARTDIYDFLVDIVPREEANDPPGGPADGSAGAPSLPPLQLGLYPPPAGAGGQPGAPAPGQQQQQQQQSFLPMPPGQQQYLQQAGQQGGSGNAAGAGGGQQQGGGGLPLGFNPYMPPPPHFGGFPMPGSGQMQFQPQQQGMMPAPSAQQQQ